MNVRDEIIKERRKFEQKQSLNALKKEFSGFLEGYDFSMQIEVTLDNYLPEYHLDYDKDGLFNFLNGISREMITNVKSYQCALFKEIVPYSHGWYYHCEDHYGGSIYIKNDGIIVYNWHYNYEKSEIVYAFESVLMSVYFTMFICFLPLFYRSINYTDKVFIKLDFIGIEKCVFFPPGGYKDYKSFNPRCELPIKRIFPLNLLNKQNKKLEIIYSIFTKLLAYCFNYNQFEIPKISIALVNKYS